MHIQEVLKEFDLKTQVHNMISAYDYDHMVYIRLFEGCNLNCEHCFIPANPKKINSEFYLEHNLTNQLVKFGNIKEGNKLYLQWHGGEPTLLGADYLKNAILSIQADTRFKYMHGIQTNLMNFHENTEKWVDLYKQHFDSQLGISWDYGIRHTKLTSLSSEQTNQQFEERFWHNVKLAKASGLELYMVVTATKALFEHFTNPFDFFEMLVERGITKVNLERITETGNARDTWNKLGLSNLEYSQYMSKFFKSYILFKDNNPDVQLSISPFDGLLRSVVGLVKNNLSHQNDKANIWDVLSHKNQGYGCWSGECDTRFHTIDSNGYKHGCTALTSEQDNKNKSLLTNVNVQKIMWIGKTNTHANQKDNIVKERETRQLSCQECQFLSICSSGCLSVKKFDQSGECSGANKLFTTILNTVQKNI